ncbi:hypothetical protein ACOMHN_005148 [Nucella lapillus]
MRIIVIIVIVIIVIIVVVVVTIIIVFIVVIIIVIITTMVIIIVIIITMVIIIVIIITMVIVIIVIIITMVIIVIIVIIGIMVIIITSVITISVNIISVIIIIISVIITTIIIIIIVIIIIIIIVVVVIINIIIIIVVVVVIIIFIIIIIIVVVVVINIICVIMWKDKLYTPVNKKLCQLMRGAWKKHKEEQAAQREIEEAKRTALSLQKQKLVSKQQAKLKLAEAEKAARIAHRRVMRAKLEELSLKKKKAGAAASTLNTNCQRLSAKSQSSDSSFKLSSQKADSVRPPSAKRQVSGSVGRSRGDSHASKPKSQTTAGSTKMHTPAPAPATPSTSGNAAHLSAAKVQSSVPLHQLSREELFKTLSLKMGQAQTFEELVQICEEYKWCLQKWDVAIASDLDAADYQKDTMACDLYPSVGPDLCPFQIYGDELLADHPCETDDQCVAGASCVNRTCLCSDDVASVKDGLCAGACNDSQAVCTKEGLCRCKPGYAPEDRQFSCKHGVGGPCDVTQKGNTCVAGARCYDNRVCACDREVSDTYGAICEPRQGRYGSTCGEVKKCEVDGSFCEDGTCVCKHGFDPTQRFDCGMGCTIGAKKTLSGVAVGILCGLAAVILLLVVLGFIIRRNRQRNKKKKGESEMASLQSLGMKARSAVQEESHVDTLERSSSYTGMGTEISDTMSSLPPESSTTYISQAPVTSQSGSSYHF